MMTVQKTFEIFDLERHERFPLSVVPTGALQGFLAEFDTPSSQIVNPLLKSQVYVRVGSNESLACSPGVLHFGSYDIHVVNRQVRKAWESGHGSFCQWESYVASGALAGFSMDRAARHCTPRETPLLSFVLPRPLARPSFLRRCR